MNKLGYPPKICKIAVLSNVASLYFFSSPFLMPAIFIRFVPVALNRKKLTLRQSPSARDIISLKTVPTNGYICLSNIYPFVCAVI